jgi:hypothetical protein
VRQLFIASPNLSLIETAYLFRNCETDEVIEGKTFSARKIGSSLQDRRGEAEWETLMLLLLLSHL